MHAEFAAGEMANEEDAFVTASDCFRTAIAAVKNFLDAILMIERGFGDVGAIGGDAVDLFKAVSVWHYFIYFLL